MSSLLTMDQEARIIQAGVDESEAVWAIGDVTNEAIQALPVGRLKQEIYDQVSDLCGRFPDTVRRRAELSRFYPDQVRQEFEALSASHFRAAKVTGDLGHSRAWLTRAVESADDYGGKPMPVRVFSALISKHYNLDTCYPPDYDQARGELIQAEYVLERMRSFWTVLSLRYSIYSTLTLQSADHVPLWAVRFHAGLDMVEDACRLMSKEQEKEKDGD